MSRSCLALWLLFLATTQSDAGGHVYNQNFSVLTPKRATLAETDDYAQRLLAQAERFRKEIAEEWLGAELPAGLGRTQINVAFSDSEDAGLTWADTNQQRKLHALYLATTPERALGTTLKHEMCHVVLATRFPQSKRLPTWIEEGIASRYDDTERIRSRQHLLHWWIETSNWQPIARVLQDQRISASDQVGYTIASSVTEFLLSRGTKKKLLRFAQAARTDLSSSLQAHYQIRDLADLQSKWQAWVSTNSR